MSDKTSAKRRTVRFSTLPEIVRDAELLLPHHATVGNWSFGQIGEHLAKIMNGSIDGLDFQAPWFARWVIAPLVKNSMLTKPMSPGFRLPPNAKPILPSDSVSPESGFQQLEAAVERLQQETPRALHPFLGKLASEEWIELHLRHAELHLSFVVPSST
jgi:hypothetical protein